jgi:hypothetical protein
LSISDDKIQDLAASAILAAMGEAERASLITAALKDLMTKKDRGYGFNRQSPLHEAFTRAMTKHAEEIASRVIAEDEDLMKRVEGMVREAIAQVVVRDREDTVSRIANAVRNAFFDLNEK